MPTTETDRVSLEPVVVVTYFTSPYQIEFFNAIHAFGTYDLTVVYLYSRGADRKWSTRRLNHPNVILNDDAARFGEALSLVRNAKLTVFNYYNHPSARRLISARHRTRMAWCFWGERPGHKNSSWIGVTYRRWRLSPLRAAKAPIWGIGNVAIERYKKEFGDSHQFVRLPYYSDLSRFQSGQRSTRVNPGFTTFLFSGSLIRRKGVDLLAVAFQRLLADGCRVKLILLGTGELQEKLTKAFKFEDDSVEFMGFKDWDELPFQYRRADVLCVPSRYDGWALVVPEGLAAGLPVISTDQTGAALDLIRDRDNGWVIRSGDSDELYKAMRNAVALTDVELTKMSTAALRSIDGHALTNGVANFHNACKSALLSWRA